MPSERGQNEYAQDKDTADSTEYSDGDIGDVGFSFDEEGGEDGDDDFSSVDSDDEFSFDDDELDLDGGDDEDEDLFGSFDLDDSSDED